MTVGCSGFGSNVTANGMVYDDQGNQRPGLILKLWAQVRKDVGVIEAKRKQGMKFDTRAATDLVDKLQAACDKHGVLVYPTEGRSKGIVVEDGTLADVELYIIVQAIEDGSYLQLYGYGQGADNQDKAGGKAGTYALKQALIQALQAGGTKAPKGQRMPDTDDTDTPIEGGVRAKTAKPKAPPLDEVKAALEAAGTEAEYVAARDLLMRASPETQVACAPIARTAKARCILT